MAQIREAADGSIGGRFAGRSALNGSQPELGVGRTGRRGKPAGPTRQQLNDRAVREMERNASAQADRLTTKMF